LLIFTKMVSSKKDMVKEIEIPEGIVANIENAVITIKKDSNEISKKIAPGVLITLEGNKVVLKTEKAGKSKRKNFGTMAGHIKNMIQGLTEGFEYELEICNVHFPMTVDFDKGTKIFKINNLLGEKYPRTVKLSDKVEIEIKAPKIIIKSYDIEAAGHTASLLEATSKIRNRDRNKFQDGIFITKKPRMEYL